MKYIENILHLLICSINLHLNMRLLFVCVGNSCRSQMAEAIATSLGFKAASAGTHPADCVSENALKVLETKGINTEGLYPKLIDNLDWKSFDMVISMGCGVNCPMIKIDQDWGLEDPFGKPLDSFLNCAEIIKENINNLAN